jgi:hypothetical protein
VYLLPVVGPVAIIRWAARPTGGGEREALFAALSPTAKVVAERRTRFAPSGRSVLLHAGAAAGWLPGGFGRAACAVNYLIL